MKHQLLKIIFFFILLAGVLNSSLFVDAQPLVREIVAIVNDTTFKYTYFYDDYRNKVMENKYYLKENASHPLTRTEWVYQGVNCIQQREQKWLNNNWETFFLINTFYADNSKVEETYISVSDNVERVEKVIVNTYVDNYLESTRYYQGNKSDNKLIHELLFNYNNNGVVQRQIGRAHV